MIRGDEGNAEDSEVWTPSNRSMHPIESKSQCSNLLVRNVLNRTAIVRDRVTMENNVLILSSIFSLIIRS